MDIFLKIFNFHKGKLIFSIENKISYGNHLYFSTTQLTYFLNKTRYLVNQRSSKLPSYLKHRLVVLLLRGVLVAYPWNGIPLERRWSARAATTAGSSAGTTAPLGGATRAGAQTP